MRQKRMISATTIRFPPVLREAATQKAITQGLNFSDYVRELVLRDVLGTQGEENAA